MRLALETAGVVVALTFVAAPFFIRGAQTAFAAVDRSWLEASRTLGASEARTFVRVAIPAAAPGMLAGLALAWGRAVGEFGATLIFAGSFRGRTQTAPLAIYERLGTDFDAALALVGGARHRVRHAAAVGEAARRPGGGGACCALRPARRLGDFDLDAVLEAPAGSCLALAGPSGAGKSTLLRIAAGLLRPAHGSVTCGEEVWLDTASEPELAPELRRCGYVFQDYALFGHMAVWQNVAYGLRGMPRAERRRRAEELLDRFGIGGARRRAAAHAVGRRAPARRAGPRARPGAARAAARRAAVGARRAHPRERLARAGRRPARQRRPGAARHARLHRGGRARRPRRGHRRRADRAGGHGGRARRLAGVGVRRGLHRRGRADGRRREARARAT